MGYNTKIHIVVKTNQICTDENLSIYNKFYADTIASFDLRKLSHVGAYLTALDGTPTSNCYFYEGNKEVFEDFYGDPLPEFTLDEAIQLLTIDKTLSPHYWRLTPAIQLLKSIQKHYTPYPNDERYPVVLHFGY
jgi:hypothetical protein